METDGRSFQVRIGHPEKTNGIPRLPHERDESDDSQQSDLRQDMLQAYADIMSGQEDTDCREQRGLEPVVKSFLASENADLNRDAGSCPKDAWRLTKASAAFPFKNYPAFASTSTR